VGQWLDAGTKLVWIIDPARREARVYTDDGGLTIVPAGGTLDGGRVLPGLRCALADVLQ
jgi:Uma2 family endonuclease